MTIRKTFDQVKLSGSPASYTTWKAFGEDKDFHWWNNVERCARTNILVNPQLASQCSSVREKLTRSDCNGFTCEVFSK